MTRKDAIKTLKELWRETNDPWYEEVYNMAINALEMDAEPTILPVGVVKEYDNGMVAMRKETYQEYHAIAVNEAVRRLNTEVLPEIERSE